MRKPLNIYMMAEGGAEGGGGGIRDYTAEASRAGWQPEDKWTGPKEKWVDAKTFLERGEHILPIVQAKLRETETELAETRRAIKELRESGTQFRSFVEQGLRREYEAKLEVALREKIKALDAGDGAGVVAAEASIEKIRDEGEKAVKEATAPKATDTSKEHPDFRAWVDKNPWYAEDGSELQLQANMLAAHLARKNPNLVGKALFEAVEKEVKTRNPKEFPEYSPEGESRRGSAVDTGSDDVRRPTGTREHVYANLPPEARAACDRFIKDGWIPAQDKAGVKLTIDQRRALYCADYQWD